jgi:hypothetical protein
MEWHRHMTIIIFSIIIVIIAVIIITLPKSPTLCLSVRPVLFISFLVFLFPCFNSSEFRRASVFSQHGK